MTTKYFLMSQLDTFLRYLYQSRVHEDIDDIMSSLSAYSAYSTIFFDEWRVNKSETSASSDSKSEST